MKKIEKKGLNLETNWITERGKREMLSALNCTWKWSPRWGFSEHKQKSQKYAVEKKRGRKKAELNSRPAGKTDRKRSGDKEWRGTAEFINFIFSPNLYNLFSFFQIQLYQIKVRLKKIYWKIEIKMLSFKLKIDIYMDRLQFFVHRPLLQVINRSESFSF